MRCILSKFYIKPQLRVIFNGEVNGCILSKFYIKPQLIRGSIRRSSVVSYRNSTSNHNVEPRRVAVCVLYLIEILHQTTTITSRACSPRSCILSKFYIKPQPKGSHKRARYGCILSKFYIKPQLKALPQDNKTVVSYRNSTSNHNKVRRRINQPLVVSYRNSTSNHNSSEVVFDEVVVVSYRNSTSNHNGERISLDGFVVVSYRNSTSNHNCITRHRTEDVVVSYRNSTSNHNCHPRLLELSRVVSYRNSTSNHNSTSTPQMIILLYLIEILHQTTTQAQPRLIPLCCILSKFYIKPQHPRLLELSRLCCILSKFYIKPQRTRITPPVRRCCILSKFYIKPQLGR